ncbi:Filamentous hemagglutinin [Bienertia sinuspersici]
MYRQFIEQQPYVVAVEVPIVNDDESGVEYVRVFHTPEADEFFPGDSQPQREQESQPSTPPKQSQPTSPPTQPKKPFVRKKITLRKKKTTPKKQGPQAKKTPPAPYTQVPPSHGQPTSLIPPPSPQVARTPSPPSPQAATPPPSPIAATPPPPSPQTATLPPSPITATPPPPQAATSPPVPPPSSVPVTRPPPSPAKPKKGGRTRPLGFRKKGSVAPKGQGSSARRNKVKPAAVAYSSEDGSGADDSSDDDYIQYSSETDDEDDISDFIEEEEEVDCLSDDIREKQFEDYLDGSSAMDKTYKNGKIWTYEEFGSIKLEPWLIFADRDSFIEAFKDYCIQEGFGVFVEKCDRKRYIARCAIDTCDWRIHASTMSDKISWAIKTMTGDHKTCGRLEENPVVTSDWLCKHLQSDIEANPEITVDSLQKLCIERYKIRVKKRLFYKVKAMAKEKIHGGFGEAYSLLPRYAEMVKKTNTGSYALVSWTQTTGNVCPRPIIGIDGAHLSGYYKGILLTAVGIDGNNEIFVIAYGIVATESIDSWAYFLRNLKILFEREGCQSDDWTFISDRMRGVDTAIHETFPRATRRICCQHLYMNCKNAGFSGTAFHKLFWIAANAYNQYVFKKAMEKIHDYDPKACEYLNSCTEQWSRHQFEPAICCDYNTTNFVESFNSCTKPYRDLPILKLLEAIRQWCMKRIGSRYDKVIDMGCEELTDYATMILKTRTDESRLCYATACGADEFEVSGIPCKHVLRVIFHHRLQPLDFVSPYFKGAAYKLAYAEHMHPMPGASQWPSFNLPDIQPPMIKRTAGRPKKQRKRGPNEARKGKRHSSVKCSNCKEMGHNKLTCAAKKSKATSQASTSKTPTQCKKRSKKAA